MHKCKNCGIDFESKFCPNCGTPAPAENCPYCGGPISPENKFCPACGRALGVPAETAPPAPPQTAPAYPNTAPKAVSPALIKLCSFLPYVVSTLFAIFSALLLLMCLGQVSNVMGMGTGSIYDYLSPKGGKSNGGLSDLFGDMAGSDLGVTADACAALVSFSAFGAVLAICVLCFRCDVPMRAKRLGKVRICTLLEAFTFVFYFVDFLLACIICGTVDDAMTSPGAGPVCVLVFSLLFALCAMGALLCKKFLPQISPSTAAELERRQEERRAGLVPPVPPEGLIVQKPGYQCAECPEELQAKVVKYAKAKKILVVLSGIMFVFVFFVCIIMCMVNNPIYMQSLTYDEVDVLIFHVLIPFSCCGTVLTTIFGGIFGAVYYKKKAPTFAWQRRSVWSDKWMFLTITAFCGALIISFLIMMVSLLPHKEVWLILFVTETLPFILAYCIVVFPCAGAIAHKGTKLSRAIYGTRRPWNNPALNAQYQDDMKEYLAQCGAREQYLRELAYYKEGIPYRH